MPISVSDFSLFGGWPQKQYEFSGNISNIVFPSSALVKDDKLIVYYGATDTTCCVATCNLSDLLKEMTFPKETGELFIKSKQLVNFF